MRFRKRQEPEGRPTIWRVPNGCQIYVQGARYPFHASESAAEILLTLAGAPPGLLRLGLIGGGDFFVCPSAVTAVLDSHALTSTKPKE